MHAILDLLVIVISWVASGGKVNMWPANRAWDHYQKVLVDTGQVNEVRYIEAVSKFSNHRGDDDVDRQLLYSVVFFNIGPHTNNWPFGNDA